MIKALFELCSKASTDASGVDKIMKLIKSCKNLRFFGYLGVYIFSLAFTALLPKPTFSQDVDQPVNVRNAGAFMCGDALSTIQEPERQIEKTAFLNWAGAYATAAARSNSLIDTFPIGDTQEFLIMVSLVCTENEAATFETAVRTTLRRIQPFWVKESASFNELVDPQGRTVQYYKEAVQPLQEHLNRYGVGISVDGVYGHETGEAIKQLNESRGARAWMTPDGEFLYHLTRPTSSAQSSD